MSHDADDGCAVHDEAVLSLLFPFGIEGVGLYVAVGQEEEGLGLPEGIHFDEEVYTRCVDAGYRFLGRIVHILVRVDVA